MVQALGSAGPVTLRQQRRYDKKRNYAEYLNSSTWKQIRAKALRRDQHRCRVAMCNRKATVVHHVRYPEVLGEERLEWLYSLCAPHHDEIHFLAQTVTLREATKAIVGSPLPKRTKKKKRRKQPQSPRSRKPPRQNKLKQENDRLHELQARNRERRRQREVAR